ncbi:hypothetical protein PanWU01x14_333070, partial [Parasponia andersonii]
ALSAIPLDYCYFEYCCVIYTYSRIHKRVK